MSLRASWILQLARSLVHDGTDGANSSRAGGANGS